MESRAFIKHAAKLSNRIKLHKVSSITHDTDEETKAAKMEIQKELTQLFSGLQNPTLPSAYKLRDTAIANGFVIEPKIQHRLQQADGYWV